MRTRPSTNWRSPGHRGRRTRPSRPLPSTSARWRGICPCPSSSTSARRPQWEYSRPPRSWPSTRSTVTWRTEIAGLRVQVRSLAVYFTFIFGVTSKMVLLGEDWTPHCDDTASIHVYIYIHTCDLRYVCPIVMHLLHLIFSSGPSVYQNIVDTFFYHTEASGADIQVQKFDW